MFLQCLPLFLLMSKMTWFDGHIEIAPLEITINIVGFHPLTDDVMPRPTHIPHKRLTFSAHEAGNLFFAGNATDDLTAVTPGCTPTDPVGLNHVYIVATFRQVQGGRNSSETCADDADISGLCPTQGIIIGNLVNSRGVV